MSKVKKIKNKNYVVISVMAILLGLFIATGLTTFEAPCENFVQTQTNGCVSYPDVSTDPGKLLSEPGLLIDFITAALVVGSVSFLMMIGSLVFVRSSSKKE